MSNQTSRRLFRLLLILLLTVILAEYGEIFRFAEGGRRRIHITDDLDDVADDEEDEAWREWGKKSAPSRAEFDPPPTDFSDMELPEIQAEMLKRQFGPVFGFVKLRLGVQRTPDMVSDIAMKWTQLSRTGSIETKFMGFDLGTIMFTMEKGQDASELKEFVLNQPEAYEIKVGDQVFRRPGDPPLEEVVEKLQNERNRADVVHKKAPKRKMGEEDVAQDKLPHDTPMTVDMNRVNNRSNLTGLVRLMTTTKFSDKHLCRLATNAILATARCIEM